MNPITNPFSPGAGAPPPELVGRDGLLGSRERKLPEILAEVVVNDFAHLLDEIKAQVRVFETTATVASDPPLRQIVRQ